MQVLLVNGSPHQSGCTDAALQEVGAALREAGIRSDTFWIGNHPLTGCVGCGFCAKTGRCRYEDTVNIFLDAAEDCAGLNRFAFKPGAALVSARRAGTTAALDELNKYLLYAQMPIVTSRYWNMVHGQTPEEVQKDLEGMQIMRVLGRNMAWMLRSIEAGRKAGIAIPEQEPRISTNFIR